MARHRIPVHRGPAAGQLVHATGKYVWIDKGGNVRGDPADGHGLYKWQSGFWEFVGDREWRCECGAINEAPEAEACGFCGARRLRLRP